VTGLLCDKCKSNYYNFLEDINDKKGCLSCFCNGLSVNCESSKDHYMQIECNFENEHTDWYVSNKFTKLNEAVDLEETGIGFSRFEEFKDEELYFIVPEKFRGNKVWLRNLFDWENYLIFNFYIFLLSCVLMVVT